MTSKQVQSLHQRVTEAAVTASYEYVSVRVVTDSREKQDVINKLVEQIDAKQHSQSTQHQSHVLQEHKNNIVTQ